MRYSIALTIVIHIFAYLLPFYSVEPLNSFFIRWYNIVSIKQKAFSSKNSLRSSLCSIESRRKSTLSTFPAKKNEKKCNRFIEMWVYCYRRMNWEWAHYRIVHSPVCLTCIPMLFIRFDKTISCTTTEIRNI